METNAWSLVITGEQGKNAILDLDVIDFMNQVDLEEKRLVDGEFKHYCPECQKMSNG